MSKTLIKLDVTLLIASNFTEIFTLNADDGFCRKFSDFFYSLKNY